MERGTGESHGPAGCLSWQRRLQVLLVAMNEFRDEEGRRWSSPKLELLFLLLSTGCPCGVSLVRFSMIFLCFLFPSIPLSFPCHQFALDRLLVNAYCFEARDMLGAR